MFVLAGIGLRGETLSPAQISNLFEEGKGFFRQANELAEKDPDQARDIFRKAALRFERMAREGGIENGKLYYNIGNAYFRMEDLGRAILNYRRALQYIPNDENLQQNLSYARARCRDRIPEPERRMVLKTLFFWHYDFTMRARSLIFASAFTAFWILAIGRLFWRRALFGPALVVTGLLAVLMFGSVLTDSIRLRRERSGVIISAEAVARKGDSMSYEQSFTEPLHAGTEFVVLEDRGDWVEIRLADERTCWLPAKDVECVR